MRNVFKKTLIAVACAVVAAGVSAASQYKQEYKLSVVPGATSGWGMAGTFFCDCVRDKTKGRINIKPYFGAQLMAGKQTSELLLVRRGAIDFALASTINWSPQIKELNLTALPFFVANNPDRYKAMDAIENGRAGQMLVEAIEKTDVKFIGWSENGFRELTTSKGPITKPEDMKGMKLRVCGTPIFIDIFTALGANPQAINWSEAVTGFQQGIVDGQENPNNGINVPTKLWTWHNHVTDWHYMIDPLFLTANKKVWESFDPADQTDILDCAAQTERYSKALSRLGYDKGESKEYLTKIGKLPEVTDATAEFEKNGMTVTEFTPEQVQEFYKATQKVRDDWTNKIGKDLVKAAEDDMKNAQ
ncbi:MAG: TRAP transporter substrate-binding protein DctP [Burkholderiales bacterium]|nr:TRAP transporter substrate-binding protein DctP [Burkholderiales bacterium]